MTKADLLPNPAAPLHAQDTLILLTMLVFGESRGEPQEGKVAVAWVVKNRVSKPRWWGDTWPSVMLRPYQFSCFNKDAPLYKLLNPLAHDRPETWLDCYLAAVGVYHDFLEDPTLGATHYFNLDIHPFWADSMEKKVRIGRHEFYREE